jgi:hypothetical protein
MAAQLAKLPPSSVSYPPNPNGAAGFYPAAPFFDMKTNSILIAFKGESITALKAGPISEMKKLMREYRDGENKEGFDRVSVWNKFHGEVYTHDFSKALRKAKLNQIRETAPPAAPIPEPEIETNDEMAEEIAELIETAQGDARKKEVREAREKLDSLGIDY